MMRFHETLRKMEQGFKVRRPSFSQGRYWCLENGKLVMRSTMDPGLRLEVTEVLKGHLFAADWEIVSTGEVVATA